MSALLTAEDVAARLRCSVKHARGLMRRKMIHIGIGRMLRVTESALEKYLRGLEIEPCHSDIRALPPIAETKPRERRKEHGR